MSIGGKEKMIDVKKRTERQSKWDSANTRKVSLKFMLKSDADILEALDKVEKKTEFVRKAIREYIENHKEEL